MQLSSIIPILLIFISNVCASPLYIGFPNNETQAISPRNEKVAFPKTMDELEKTLGSLMKTLNPFHFYFQWAQADGLKTGKENYPSCQYKDGYGTGHTPAIIKGIWTTRVSKPRTKEEVIQEVFYLKTFSKNINLLGFFINAHPTPEAIKSPDYLIIIEDKGYLHQQDQTSVSSNLRRNAKTALKGHYTPVPSFLNQQSFLYERYADGSLGAVFI
ncbi:hypothetical protein F5887DRAFT_957460 [Amanita rubescens]|nr:hypothetical protein F5887DRAFT_957460 [Amanita rubescens]